ncbi:8-amino-7-oxononanoate synthase [Dactylosporangium sp. NPDC051484]|uniref:8-amino-7-oxononanoate synthase n=1 Tax=Dactylosporangium sp. NPDC051484 TaxID=3154942 RepID=UPI00344E2C1B
MEWLSALDEEAAARRAAGLRRELLPRAAGTADPVVDLAGNDYLGLSRHPQVLAAAVRALEDFGLGATGSRLVRGSTESHRDLETALAALLGMPAALVYSSGYLANLGAVRALVRRGTLVVSDAHNHASIVDGCRLACAGRAAREGAETVVAPHADPAALRDILARHPGRPAVVVTESVFSVDGDLAPLADIYAVARAHGALMLVDDAHALGVIGPAGAGGVAAAGLSGAPGIVVTATLSKSLGAAGGVIAGPEQLRRELIDTGRTFIFDTALPPAVAAGALAALRLLADGDDLRAELHARARRTVQRLRGEGLEVSEPAGGVISIAAPGPDEALAWAAACRDRGVAVGCFRPPSTPDGRSRLRLTVGVGVPAAAFDRAVDIIVKERP